MDFFKKNKVLIAIVLTVLILVLIRSMDTDHFKNDAIKWAEPSISRSNIFLKDQIGLTEGEKLIINLDETSGETVELSKDAISMPAITILNKDNLKKIHKHNGPILLFSATPEVSIRIWMLLSQLGYKNLYILTTDSDNEVLKYKFRNDTLIKADF
jgi:hypothetical protein